jgi:Cap4 SAVED domain
MNQGGGAVSWPSVLVVRVEDHTAAPALVALCAGYERGEWRAEALVDDLVNWLPEFALTEEELRGLDSSSLVRLLRKALHNIYTTQKFTRRGELGELILHSVLRRLRATIPAISKLYYKDSANVTVKGFDAVHVVAQGGELELWLGEVKLYTSVDQAIRDVVGELNAHTKTEFLRGEFIAITNKIDARWPHADRLRMLLDPNVSLDQIFSRLCIPVLLTYDSKTIKAHSEVSAAFKVAFEAEVRGHHASFASKGLPPEVRIELFLLPMNTKKKLSEIFHRKLMAWQTL